VSGGFINVRDHNNILELASSRITQGDSQDIGFIKDATVDIVLTDPPYFDNISYSELSDFFLPWQQQLNLIPRDESSELAFRDNLSANGRNDDSIEEFQISLGKCFSEIARVTKSNGQVIFTYQHKTPGAWYALASAISRSGLRPIQLFPLLGDCPRGLHKHEGSSKWDAVFVLRKDCGLKVSDLSISDEVLESAQRHYSSWTQRLERNTNGLFGNADRKNFNYACLVAGALGMFPNTNQDRGQKISLKKSLGEVFKPTSNN
jgi:adenine-specific DNA methylase